MKEKNKKKQIVKISVFITSMFVILFSVTYAFITQTLTGTKEVVINAGVLDLVLEEENAITISDALPMYDEVGMIQDDVFKFRLVNKTANDTNYILKLQEIETGTLDKSIVKYGLIKEKEKTIDFVSNIVDGVIDEGKIAGSDTINYELRLWIDSSVTEITQVKSKFLSFKLSAGVSQDIMFVKALDDIVIDFGLPVEIKQPKLDEGRIVEKLSYATYGKVEIEGDSSKEDFTVIYTPTEILQGIDTVHLLTDDNKEYTFDVYPATTVYYEEGFAEGSKGDWATLTKNTTLKQTVEKVGKKVNVYGFDEAYYGTGASNNTFATSNEASICKLEFTGTGIDIYTNSTENSGNLMAWIRDSEGKTVKAISVLTSIANGTDSYIQGQNVNLYNLPVISLTGLTHGKYTVELRHIGQSVSSKVVFNPVSLDGYRIHGTLDIKTTIYELDNEASPTFFELRNSVLVGLDVDISDSQYSQDIAEDILAQVHANAENEIGAIVLSNNKNTTVETSVQELLNNGPKKELFLLPGQAVIFALNDGVNAQIGLKAPGETVHYKMLSSDEEFILNSSTDMFYHDLTGQVVISNTGDNILSITKLKAFGDTDIYFTDITIDTINKALEMLN